ncbi:MAG: restriction endonuclease subunit S [Candidatus Onthomorpha sp.]|nr:restriction endonuclease subunit S [Candidatus Onthomorpha sp.]
MKEPKLRFKGFEGEWETSIIGDMCSISTGKSNTQDKIEEGKYPFYVRSPFVERSNKFLFDEEAVLTVGDGVGTGKVFHYVNGKYDLHQRVYRMFDFCNIYAKFFYYYFSTKFYKRVMSMTAKSSVDSVRMDMIADMKIDYPSTAEQQSIASYFQHLDSLIQSTTKKIESLKQVKAASLQSMFPQEGETTPRVRFKGFEGEWEKVLVGSLGTTYSGLSGKTKDDFGIGEARFVTFLNVLTNARIDTSILELVNVNGGEHQNEVKKGDLLFNTSSETPEEVGMCAVMDEELKDVYLNSFCFGLRVTDENVVPTCVAYLIRSHIGRKIMSILAQGATRYNLSKNSFCKAELLLPKTKAEQRAIASYFTNLDRQITLQNQRLEKLKQIKAACLDNMFV